MKIIINQYLLKKYSKKLNKSSKEKKKNKTDNYSPGSIKSIRKYKNERRRNKNI